MVKSPTVVDAGTPELDTGTGRAGRVKFQVACPYSPYGKPHIIKVEVLREDWQEVMELKFGGKTPQNAWDQYTGKTWVPYSGIEIAGHEMEIDMKCPFCGKEFDALLRVPDWVINALPDEIAP